MFDWCDMIISVKISILLSVCMISAALFSPLSAAEKKGEKKPDEAARWFLAGAADKGRMDKSSTREKQLVSMLDELAKASGELAVESSDLALELQKLIAETGVSPARAASLRIKAERVIRMARSVAAVTEGTRRTPGETLAKCRILAINPKLALVAIEAGSRSGVFKGMVFKTLDTENPVELRISITHPDISGAVVVKGSMSDLAPGMSVTAIEHRNR